MSDKLIHRVEMLIDDEWVPVFKGDHADREAAENWKKIREDMHPNHPHRIISFDPSTARI